MVFQPPFDLNNKYEGDFKGGVPLFIGVQRRCSLLARRPRNLGFLWPRQHNLVGSWDISRAVKPDIEGVAGANMWWGCLVCLSCSQRRENTAFQLVLQSTWRLSSSGKQVGRSSIPCQKRSQVWGRESERRPKYTQQRRHYWKWEGLIN